jgi:hypothetical protein
MFGVLQSKWQIVANPSYLWDRVIIANMLMACDILHNMVISDEQRDCWNRPLNCSMALK